MMRPMIFGLGAAFAWGAADFGVALLARRIGSFTTLVLAQLGGIVLFSALLATPVGSLPRFHPGLLILPVIGISGALSYVAFYRALELGPIALVSPIAAGYAAIVIALSLIFLGEHVAALALGGAAAAIAGVVLASTDLRRMPVAGRRVRRGLFFAVLAMLGFGVGAFLIGAFAKDTGWFEPSTSRAWGRPPRWPRSSRPEERARSARPERAAPWLRSASASWTSAASPSMRGAPRSAASPSRRQLQ